MGAMTDKHAAPPVSRRTLLGVTLAGAVAGAAGCGVTGPPGEHATTEAAPLRSRGHEPGERTNERREEVLVGSPLQQVVIPVAGWGRTPDGRDIAVMVAAGSPGTITVIDAKSGAALEAFELHAEEEEEDATASAWAVAVDSESGTAFVGTTDGRAFLIDTATMSLAPVSGVPADRPFFERAVPDGDGGFLATTYGDGRLLRFTPTPPDDRAAGSAPGGGTWREYGPFGEENAYSIGLARAGTDAYVGTGTSEPAVFKVGLTDGRIERIDLPAPKPSYSGERTFVYDLAVSGDYLFARVDPENRVYIRNTATGHWTASIPDVAPGLAVQHPGSSHPALFFAGLDQRLYEYDPVARTRPVRRSLRVSALRGAGWIRLPGRRRRYRLTTTNATGMLLTWDATTGASGRIRADVKAGSRPIRSLGAGPDGRLFAGAFGTAYSVATYTPQPLTDEFQDGSGRFGTLPCHGQIEAFGVHGHDLLAGSYPGANLQRLMRWNPLAPAGHSNSPLSARLGNLLDPDAEAPRRRTSGSRAVETPEDGLDHVKVDLDLAPDTGQDRPVCLLSHGGRVLVGTAPDYGQTGGALTIVDPAFTAQRSYRDVVPGQSPLCLAPGRTRDEALAGMGPAAGYGAEAAAAEGRVARIDLRTGEVLASTVPVAGEMNVSALALDADDGTLWGITRNSVFQLRVPDLRVLRAQRYGDRRDSARYVTGRTLHDAGTALMGCAGGDIFEIDKATLARRLIARGTNLVRLESGELYYSRGSQLFRRLH